MFPAVCQINAEGTLLATGGTDQLVKLWDYARGTCLADGVGHSNTIVSLAFSPDGKQLISVGQDGNIFVWNVYDA